MRNPRPIRRRTRQTTAWLALAALLYAPPGVPVAHAGVEGENVVAGDVSIERLGDLVRITASDGSIIEMDRLSVLSGETLQFLQPSEAARVLNRVLGVDPTKIEGNLLANGQVYILNASGIFFGGNAVVDVGRLVAGAGQISNADFVAGVDRFTALAGTVENRGTIHADGVSLVGQKVANHGRIVAPDGMIAMVAGEDVFLGSIDGRILIHVEGPASDPSPNDWAVQNTGTLDAGNGEIVLGAGDVYSLAANHTGTSRARNLRIAGGSGGLVQVAGSLDASDTRPGATGGSIHVTGDRVAILDAEIDASGDAGGGEILIGGDVRGNGELPNARRSYVSPDARIRADALSQGNGGSVVARSDEATWSYGEISARGGAAGGDGGFVEISGDALVSEGAVDVGARHGRAGTLLYDPTDIEIVGGEPVAGDASPVDLQVAFGDEPLDSAFEVFESQLESSDANVELEASRSITARGDFGNDDVLLMPDRSLTLSTVNATEDGGIDLTTSDDGTNLTFRTQGGAIQFQAGTGAGQGVTSLMRVGRIETGGGTAIVSNFAGSSVIGSVDSRGGGDAGDIALAAQGRKADTGLELPAVSGDVTVTGSILASGADATDPEADGGQGGTVQVLAVNGSIDIGSAEDGTSLDTSGGNGATGGDAGFVLLSASGAPASGASFAPDAAGDPMETSPAVAVVRGDLSVSGEVLAMGGQGDTGDGGDGGFIQLATTLGSIDLGASVNTSGGDGQVGGGDGAAISMEAVGLEAVAPVLADVANPADPDGDPLEDFVVREGTAAQEANIHVADDLIVRGGSGIDGNAGDGGVFNDPNFGPTAIGVSASATVGSITVTSIDTRGGQGKTGGDSGNILLTTLGSEDPTPDVSDDGLNAVAGNVMVTGTLTTRGGTATGPTPEDVENNARAFRGGRGGAISLGATRGSVSAGDMDASGGDGEVAGDGGSLFIDTTLVGDVTLDGQVVSRGGAGNGAPERRSNGGNGGSLVVSVFGDGNASVGLVDVSGGNGDDLGGDGGNITLETVESSVDTGDLVLDGPLVVSGGSGAEGAGDPGDILLRSSGALLGRVVVSSDLAIDSTRMGSASERFVIAGDDLSTHTLQVVSAGDSAVDLGDASFGTLDWTQSDAGADVDVTLAGGGFIRAEGQPESGPVDPDAVDPDTPAHHTVSADTTAEPLFLAYKLENRVGELPAELSMGTLHLGGDADFANEGNLNIPTDSIHVTNQAQLELRADTDRDGFGSLVAVEGGPHIESDGDVRLDGVSIGEGNPLVIRGSGTADRLLDLIALGDVDVAVTDPGFATIVVSQFDSLASVDVVQGPEGARDEIHIGPAEASEGGHVIRDLRVDTTANAAGLIFRGLDGVLTPELLIPSGSVALGGNSGFSNLADITLGDDDGVAVEMHNGADLAFVTLGSLRDGAPATSTSPRIVMSADGTDAGGLILEAGGGVGEANDPIVVQGAGDLAGAAAGGDFYVANTGAAAGTGMRVTEIEHPDPGRGKVTGIASQGFVSLLETGAGSIFLAGALDEGESHVDAVSGIFLGGDVRVEDDAFLSSRAGGVEFASAVDAVSDGGASLSIDAPGAIRFGGAVGGSERLHDLDLTGLGKSELQVGLVRTSGSQTFGGGVSLTENTRFEAGEAVGFGRAVDGADLEVRVQAGDDVTFGGDVGADAPLKRLEVETPGNVVFSGAERVRADEAILLKLAGQEDVPAEATIYKRRGPLSFETSRFEVGEHEKISVGGSLSIDADVARFGDVSAGSLDVNAPVIQLLARRPGPAYTTGGDVITDGGLDIVANGLRFSTTPEIVDVDSVGTPVVTLATIDGEVAIPSLDGFGLHLINDEGTGVTVSNLSPNGTVVDLVFTGPEAVGDASGVIPRKQPAVTEWVPPRFGADAPVSNAEAPSADTVLAYLQCADLQGGSHDLERCLAPVAAGTSDLPTFDARALQTERARDAARLYRELLSTHPPVEAQRLAFDQALADYRRDQPFGEVDGASFYRYLESSRRYRETVVYVEQIAHLLTQLQLLDLDPTDQQKLREGVAGELVQALQPDGLSAQALLDVVGASRVGLP